jgi:hypothetical protein
VDPNEQALVVDRGGDLLEGVLAKETAPQQTILLPAAVHVQAAPAAPAALPVVLPASAKPAALPVVLPASAKPAALPVVLPASAVAWGASSFTLSARIFINGSAACAAGCTIFYKGPTSHTHVPDDKRM